MQLTDTSCFDERWGNLDWLAWLPLDAPLIQFQESVPKLQGFYRIRAIDQSNLIYIGQTGRSLRERLRALSRGVYRESTDPPWNDPHTAAPLLWAYRHEDHMKYEFSVSIADLEYPIRQCTEDALLYLHRKECGSSTLCNHGRLHPQWTRPSNRKQGVPAKRRQTYVGYESLPPAMGNMNTIASDWLGLTWSVPKPLNEKSPNSSGVYRILNNDEIVYIGESSNLESRIKKHFRSQRFSDCLVSVHEMLNAMPHNLKERETDLIGAYFQKRCKPPIMQYRPDKQFL